MSRNKSVTKFWCVLYKNQPEFCMHRYFLFYASVKYLEVICFKHMNWVMIAQKVEHSPSVWKVPVLNPSWGKICVLGHRHLSLISLCLYSAMGTSNKWVQLTFPTFDGFSLVWCFNGSFSKLGKLGLPWSLIIYD